MPTKIEIIVQGGIVQDVLGLPRDAEVEIHDYDVEGADTSVYLNHYTCPDCGRKWDDEYECMVDDDCPHCGCRHVTPVTSDEVHVGKDEVDCDDDGVDFIRIRWSHHGTWKNPEAT